MAKPRRDMIPASSSDDESDSGSHSSEDESSSASESELESARKPQKVSYNNSENTRQNTRKELEEDSDDDDDDDSENESSRSDSDSAKDEDEERNKSLSLKDRLYQEEVKQSAMSTTPALKEQRERRIQALPLAKERLKEYRRQREEKNGDNKIPVQKKSKKSKHAPTEASSRRRHNKTLNERGIGVTFEKRYQARDPRMSSLSGHLDQDRFEHQYGFLDTVQSKEIATLKAKLKAMKSSGKKGQRTRQKFGIAEHETVESLQEQLQTLQQKVASQNQQRLERNAKKAVKKKLQTQVAEGKGGMYFPKRRELKKMEMEAKIAEIQKHKGKRGLENYLAKQRKKHKSRDAKRMKNMEPSFGRN